jgi:predicted phage terminase large subunit-like protein
MALNPAQIAHLQALPPDQQEVMLDLLDELDHAENLVQARSDFMSFTRHMWPAFIEGRHHKIMAQAFDRVIAGKCKRLIINMGPRHTKSEFASVHLPASFLGHHPDKKVIQTSHTAELAVGFGRRVRNLVDTEEFHEVFPDLSLSADAKAAGRWTTSRGGEYFAIGVGGKVAGKGADLLIIDDPHSEQEQMAPDPAVFDRVYEWYTGGPRQRLQPGGAIVIVMCMTGDTPVLMADGAEKPLADIRKGDQVATFDNGRITTSTVNNHRSNGLDSVYTVQTQSGRMVRANRRHPFLVEHGGKTSWVRLQHLKPGDQLVSLKDAPDQLELRHNPVNAVLAKHETATTARTRMHRIGQLASTGNGRERSASVASRFIAGVFAPTVTSRRFRPAREHRDSAERDGLNIATVLRWSSMRRWLSSRMGSVLSAITTQHQAIPALTGAASCASTTITPPGRFADYFAMIATSQWATERHQKISSGLLNTYGVTRDRVESITYDGIEEVFDVEIDRTENFIANGLVSHNTRWSLRDLTGQIIKKMTKRTGVDQWELIEFPALFGSGVEDDPFRPLWPEFWPLEELLAIRDELPAAKWNAQYLQNPTSEEGALIKREWWRIWDQPEPPQCQYIIQAWDTAFLKTQRADKSACTTWGIFYRPDDTGVTQANIILLDAYNARLEFPELKKLAIDKYREFNPDSFIIEGKASGWPLIFELRALGIPVQDYTPARGTKANPNDKVARVNAISDIFASGMVWRPETRWAEETADQFAAFPTGDFDDLVDSRTIAIARFRQGGFIRLDSDEAEQELPYRNIAPYY